MMWDPPNAYASFVLSIGGGVLAGFVVVALEWGWRYWYGWRQQRKAIRDLSTFFGEWESILNTADGFQDPASGITRSKQDVQFAMHKYRLWTVPIIMARWAKYISGEQTQEFNLLISNHENAVLSLVPASRVLSQNIYDMFFREARKVKWLKF